MDDLERRQEIVDELAKRGIEFESLAEAAKMPDADPFDLLCHFAFQSTVRTRKGRAAKLKDIQPLSWKYGNGARAGPERHA